MADDGGRESVAGIADDVVGHPATLPVPTRKPVRPRFIEVLARPGWLQSLKVVVACRVSAVRKGLPGAQTIIDAMNNRVPDVAWQID